MKTNLIIERENPPLVWEEREGWGKHPSFEAKPADDRYVVYPQRYLGKFSGYATLWYPPDYDPKEDIPHFLGFIKKTAAEAKALAEFHYAPSNKVL
jgi:hypothetical protein